MITSSLTYLAQEQEQATGGGPDMFTIILLVGAGLLLFMMFRRSKKTQEQQTKMRTSLEPGTRVMTQFGLFGEIVSVDQDNSEVILELSPGNFATVHIQVISRVLDETPAEEAAAEESLTYEESQNQEKPDNDDHPDSTDNRR